MGELDLGREYRPHCVRSVLTSSVKMPAYRPPARFSNQELITDRVRGPLWGTSPRGRGSTDRDRTKTTESQFSTGRLEQVMLVSSLVYDTRAMLSYACNY